MLSSRFSYCGNKDKNAVTLQRLCIWRVHLDTLNKAANLSSNAFKIFNISSSQEPLQLGDLAGNHFITTLRYQNDLMTREIKDKLIKKIEMYTTTSFLNLFGNLLL